jgi:para-nitrobenzyl esterase
MRTKPITMTLALLASHLALNSSPLYAQNAATAQPAHYSVKETLIGKMLDDPAAAAVLKEMIPGVYTNDQFQSAGRALTLKDVQTYEPDALSDTNLAKIQAALDKIPAKP